MEFKQVGNESLCRHIMFGANDSWCFYSLSPFGIQQAEPMNFGAIPQNLATVTVVTQGFASGLRPLRQNYFQELKQWGGIILKTEFNLQSPTRNSKDAILW